jgi:ribosomal RNA-processing protein 1
MWHSDKPVVQNHLTEQLSLLTFIFETPEESLNFVDAFWKTIILEWHGIDRLRFVMLETLRFVAHISDLFLFPD